MASASLRAGEEGRDCRAHPDLVRCGGGVGGRPSRESRRRGPRRGRPGVIENVGGLGVGVKVPCSSVDRFEGAADGSIVAIFAIEALNVETIDDPREVGALAECACCNYKLPTRLIHVY